MSGQSLFIPASTTLLCTYRTHIVTYIHTYTVHSTYFTLHGVLGSTYMFRAYFLWCSVAQHYCRLQTAVIL